MKNIMLIIGVVIEIVTGLFGIYGVGHLINRRFAQGFAFLAFTLFWLYAEGIIKHQLLLPTDPLIIFGLCSLSLHLPPLVVSVVLLLRHNQRTTPQTKNPTP